MYVGRETPAEILHTLARMMNEIGNVPLPNGRVMRGHDADSVCLSYGKATVTPLQAQPPSRCSTLRPTSDPSPGDGTGSTIDVGDEQPPRLQAFLHQNTARQRSIGKPMCEAWSGASGTVRHHRNRSCVFRWGKKNEVIRLPRISMLFEGLSRVQISGRPSFFKDVVAIH